MYLFSLSTWICFSLLCENKCIIGTVCWSLFDDLNEREREREREMQSRATRVTVLRTVALMILKLVNPLESLEDRIAIHMNRLLCAPLVFSSSSLK